MSYEYGKRLKGMPFEPLRCEGCSKQLGIVREFDLNGTYIFCSQKCVEETAARQPQEPPKPSTEPPIYIRGIHYVMCKDCPHSLGEHGKYVCLVAGCPCGD